MKADLPIMPTRHCIPTLVLSFLLLQSSSLAGTITVGHGDGYDSQTITAALTASASGDTILVASGVYDATSGETFPLSLKSGISLIGDMVDGMPVIRGDGKHSVVVVEDADLVTAAGFIIREGSCTRGGGISSVSSSMTVIDCKIVQNHAHFGGGATYLEDSTAEMYRCDFSENEVSGTASRGGGLESVRSFVCLRDCVFSGNDAKDAGGALSFNDSEVTVTGCRIEMNRARVGGGVVSQGGPVGLYHSLLQGNGAVVGGGLWLEDARQIVSSCRIEGNDADSLGGGGRLRWRLTRIS